MPEEPESEGTGDDQTRVGRDPLAGTTFLKCKRWLRFPEAASLILCHRLETPAVLTLDPSSFHDPLAGPDVILDRILTPALLPCVHPSGIYCALINEHRQPSVPPLGTLGLINWTSTETLSRGSRSPSPHVRAPDGAEHFVTELEGSSISDFPPRLCPLHFIIKQIYLPLELTPRSPHSFLQRVCYNGC